MDEVTEYFKCCKRAGELEEKIENQIYAIFKLDTGLIDKILFKKTVDGSEKNSIIIIFKEQDIPFRYIDSLNDILPCDGAVHLTTIPPRLELHYDF